MTEPKQGCRVEVTAYGLMPDGTNWYSISKSCICTCEDRYMATDEMLRLANEELQAVGIIGMRAMTKEAIAGIRGRPLSLEEARR